MKQLKHQWERRGLPQPHVVGALLRRNFLYRRRNWVGSIMEIALPVLMILAVLLLKSVSPGKNTTKQTKFYNTTIPNASEAFIPLTFGDYVTALQANRTCYVETKGRYKGLLGISGMPNGQYDWQVPFVRCNDMQCRYVGQDAQPFCEYLILGIAPDEANDIASRNRAVRFRDWIWEQYPVLTSNRIFSSSGTVGTVLRKLNNTILPFRFDFVQLFKSRSDMDAYITSPDYGSSDKPKLALGVLWAGGNSTQNYKYFLRQNATLFNVPAEQDHPAARTTPNTHRKFDPYAKDDEWCEMAYGAPFLGERQYSCTGQYLYNGVLTLQNLIGKFILQDSKAWETFPVAEAGIAFVPFPSPAYKDGGFFSNLGELVGIMICLGLLMPVASMVGGICREKELRQKELMKMMGVTEGEIGWSWFVSYLLFYVGIVATIVSIVSFQLYENSNTSTLYGFWVLTFTALITYCMALSTLVSNGTRGVVIGIMTTLMGTFLVMAYSFWKGEAGTIQLISLHPVAAFSYGLQEIGRLEDAGVGVTDTTIEATDGPSGYNFWMCIRMLMIDIAMWGLLAWYLNRVVQPVYGTALPFLFPFTRSYWLGPRHDVVSYNDDVAPVQAGTVDIPIEEVSDSLRQQTRSGQSIEVNGLTKQFGSQIAVDNLSLSIYKNQVTAILGHNGAGKTTTMSMLTGTLLPTAGYTVVCGRDSRTQMREIRKNIGICLQHDCLFPQLTVREHVEFFARVKGVYASTSRSEADQSVNEAINDLALSTKSDTFSRRLSGGMKRKLSVAIAFCGGSEAVMLDEPTSGMDPFSRRLCWNVIRRYRMGRVIVLTTHFMDEADILGDRIAIMNEGRLCCLGSPLFLKRSFGVGYQLTIELPKSNKGKKERNHRKVQKAVTKAVKQAVLISHVGSEMSYRLPVGASSQFCQMFDKLDRAVERKRAVSYGVGITTLEEVFIRVSRDESKQKETDKGEMKATEIGEDERIVLEDDATRFVRHTQALFKKRVSNFRRDKRAWLCTTLLPSLFVFTGFLSIKLIPNERDFKPIPLRIEDYNVDATSPRNPVGVNSPLQPFTCQPGYCAYNESETLHDLKETNETYYFCGEQARVDWYSNHSCTISVPAVDVVSRIAEAGASPVVQNVSTVKEVSSQLWNLSRSNAFAASQYGALYFTRDNSSILNETGELLDDELYYACEEAYEDADYMTLEECESFLGLGYLISYNFTALHVSPTFQVLATQSLAREAMKTNDFQIDCILDPLPITLQERGFSDEDKAFNAWYLVVLGFPFVAGAFATFVVEEKESKSKHLQTVAGVHPAAYWVSTFLWDVANYAFPMGITLILMFAFDVTMLTTSKKDVLSGVIVLLLLFGPAAASFTYCLSLFFRSPSRCNVFVIIQGFFFGVGGPLAVLYLQIYGREIWKPQPKLIMAANAISWVMRFNPFFCLGKGLLYVIYIETIHLIEKGVSSVWSSEILKYEVIFLAWQSIGYLLLAILLDRTLTSPRFVEIYEDLAQFLSFKWLLSQESPASASFASPEDDDVIAEQDRVARGKASEELIVLNKLTKVYSNGKKAVDRLSLGIAPGQCFGLLGINGAGKTTTMQMLTAEFPPTSGDAMLAGFSVINSPGKTRSKIGYCPQFDAHFPNLTGREHVELYARIKGIPISKIEHVISRKLDQVGLKAEDRDRLASDYSGGMKRRLSLACAMVGLPRIVFLDEVSTGVDPVARREIWRLISELVNDTSLPPRERTSAILTTHSMEECEALCSRIGIMANGRLRCLGSAQHIKNKFGKGFQLEMKVQLVKSTDDDYLKILADLRQRNSPECASVGLHDATSFLQELTGDDSLSCLLAESDPSGHAIFKDASSEAGVQVIDLAAFAALEQRILDIHDYVKSKYSKYFFRERQDAKVRFEVESDGIKSIFANIEANKRLLRLSDYSVSQTSLEQVFNQHAKEAEGHHLVQTEGSQDKTIGARGIKSWFSWKNDEAEEVESESSANEDRHGASDSPTGSSQSSWGSSDSWDRLRRLLSPQRSVPLLPLFRQSNESFPSPPLESLVNPEIAQHWSSCGTGKENSIEAIHRNDQSVEVRTFERPLSDHMWPQSQSERVLNHPGTSLAGEAQESFSSHIVPLASAEQQITGRNDRTSRKRWICDPRSIEFFSWLERQVASYKKDAERLSVESKQMPAGALGTTSGEPGNQCSRSFPDNANSDSSTLGSHVVSKEHNLEHRNARKLQNQGRPRNTEAELIQQPANDLLIATPPGQRTNEIDELEKICLGTLTLQSADALEPPVSPHQISPKVQSRRDSPAARLHARTRAPHHRHHSNTDPEIARRRRSVFVDLELPKETTPNRDEKGQRNPNSSTTASDNHAAEATRKEKHTHDRFSI